MCDVRSFEILSLNWKILDIRRLDENIMLTFILGIKSLNISRTRDLIWKDDLPRKGKVRVTDLPEALAGLVSVLGVYVLLRYS